MYVFGGAGGGGPGAESGAGDGGEGGASLYDDLWVLEERRPSSTQSETSSGHAGDSDPSGAGRHVWVWTLLPPALGLAGASVEAEGEGERSEAGARAAGGGAGGPHHPCWPSPRKSPALACSGRRLYLHGGNSMYGQHYNDVYCLELSDVDAYLKHQRLDRLEGKAKALKAAGLSWRRIVGGGGAGCIIPPACFSHTLTPWQCNGSSVGGAGGSRPHLLLTGGYPTLHHDALFVFDTASESWCRVHAGLPPASLGDFVPVRHSAGILMLPPPLVRDSGAESERGGATPLGSEGKAPAGGEGGVEGSEGSLLLVGGGAFCFSFGSVFSGQWRLDLGHLRQALFQQLEEQKHQKGKATQNLRHALTEQWQQEQLKGSTTQRDPQIDGGNAVCSALTTMERTAVSATSVAPPASASVTSATPSATAYTSATSAAPSATLSPSAPSATASAVPPVTASAPSAPSAPSWVLEVSVVQAKAAKDALKLLGWLDLGKKAGVVQPAAEGTVGSAVSGTAAAGTAVGASTGAAGVMAGVQARTVALPLTRCAVGIIQSAMASSLDLGGPPAVTQGGAIPPLPPAILEALAAGAQVRAWRPSH